MLCAAQGASDPKLFAHNHLWGSRSSVVIDYYNPNLEATITSTFEQGMAQVTFYLQIVAMANSPFTPRFSTTPFGDAGWEVITLMYQLERLLMHNRDDDTRWAAWKNGHGFGTYTRTEAVQIPHNDLFLVLSSCVLQLDMRPFFDMWGVFYTTKANAQVAAYGYALAPRRYWAYPVEGYRSNNFGSSAHPHLLSLPAVASFPVISGAPMLPDIPMFKVYFPDNSPTVLFSRSVPVKVWVAGTGYVSFRENGIVIPGCALVPAARRNIGVFSSV